MNLPAPSSPVTWPGCVSRNCQSYAISPKYTKCCRCRRSKGKPSRTGSGTRTAFAGGLTHIAIERQAQVGKEEGGSNFTTVANQFAFLNYPELRAHTQTSSFDPLDLAGGDTDLFVVAPEETIEHVKGWLRLWVAIPNAVAGIKPLERDLLIVIDEMPRLGYLKPVMDGYTMAAGKGVHFWCFAQSISALDSTWGKEHRKTLLHLAEVVQILGFPRTDAEGAEELSKAIGTATFEARTENRSGTIAENRIVTANTQWQAGESRALVRERLITPDELMTDGPRSPIYHRLAQGHAARCTASPSRALLAPLGFPQPCRSQSVSSSASNAPRKATKRDCGRSCGYSNERKTHDGQDIHGTGRARTRLGARWSRNRSAIAEPHWLWEAIAAEESPSSVEMEDAETDPGAGPDAGPDAGNEQKGGGTGGANRGRSTGKIRVWRALVASLRNSVDMIQESAERTENEAFGKLDRMEEQTKTLTAAVAANAAALREFAGAERAATRSSRNSGTAEGREPDFHGRLPSLGRRAARVSPLVVGACAGRRCSGLLPAWRIGRVAVPDCSRRTIRAAAGAATSGTITALHNRRVRDGSKAGGPRGEVCVRCS